MGILRLVEHSFHQYLLRSFHSLVNRECSKINHQSHTWSNRVCFLFFDQPMSWNRSEIANSVANSRAVCCKFLVSVLYNHFHIDYGNADESICVQVLKFNRFRRRIDCKFAKRSFDFWSSEKRAATKPMETTKWHFKHCQNKQNVWLNEQKTLQHIYFDSVWVVHSWLLMSFCGNSRNEFSLQRSKLQTSSVPECSAPPDDYRGP